LKSHVVPYLKLYVVPYLKLYVDCLNPAVDCLKLYVGDAETPVQSCDVVDVERPILGDFGLLRDLHYRQCSRANFPQMGAEDVVDILQLVRLDLVFSEY
jgi:hypothetical protein